MRNLSIGEAKLEQFGYQVLPSNRIRFNRIVFFHLKNNPIKFWVGQSEVLIKLLSTITLVCSPLFVAN